MMEQKTALKVILADDHQLVRSGMKLLLETDPSIRITDEGASAVEVLKKLKTTKDVDIVLTDYHMPDMSGMELLIQLKAEQPERRVIFLTMVEDEKTVTEAFENGLDGYLTKDISTDELLFAINHIYNGGKYISANLSHRFFIKGINSSDAPQLSTSPLTFNEREIEVLELISEGLTNSEMGEKLFLSKRTVEGHRRALIEKTRTRNSAALVKYAVRHGLIK